MARFIHRRRASPLPRGAVAQGGHRSVSWMRQDGMEWVEKREHAKRESTIMGVPIRVPMRVHMGLKHGRLTPNELEWKHFHTFFKRVPKSLRENFAQPYGLSRGKEGVILYMEAISDYTGQRSLSLNEFGVVQNPFFWKKFDSMLRWMIDSGAVHFALKPENIVVKRISETESIPVLIDYKNMDPRRYFLQPWLRIPALAREKMLRRYARVRRKYSAEK